MVAVVAGFRSLLEVLWNVFDELSGTVATKDEPYVQMPDKRPEFRFESVSTAWGDISRLTAYWLSLGAVRWEYLHPSRNLNGIFILSPERALELAEEGRKQGASPHPFALLKSKGIYRADVAREIRRLAADK